MLFQKYYSNRPFSKSHSYNVFSPTVAREIFMPLQFRPYINWDSAGLTWDETLHIPLRLIDFLHDCEELDESDRVLILRIYTLLQIGDPTPDARQEINRLAEKIKDKQYLGKDEDGDYNLIPLYRKLFSDLDDSGYGYFINGEFLSFPFPTDFLDILKYMKLHGANGERRNKTSGFILAFLFQLVTHNGEKFIKDNYFCGNKPLNADRNNLLYAIAKTCYESQNDWDVYISENFESGVKVRNGSVIADILDQGQIAAVSSVRGEMDVLDELTRVFHLERDGEDVANRIPPETYKIWRVYWQKLINEFHLSPDEILTLLPHLFNSYRYVPEPHRTPNPKNPAKTSLGMMLLAEKQRNQKETKGNNPYIATAVIE